MLDAPVTELLSRLADERPTPGSGSAAALGVAMAAGLVEMIALASADWDERSGIRAQASCLRSRASQLAPIGADAYGAVLDALESASGDLELGRRLGEAAEAPLLVAETGADVAELALLAAERGDPQRRADAVAAALLAEGAVRASAHLVAVNLAAMPGDERTERASAAAAAAAAAAKRAAGESG